MPGNGKWPGAFRPVSRRRRRAGDRRRQSSGTDSSASECRCLLRARTGRPRRRIAPVGQSAGQAPVRFDAFSRHSHGKRGGSRRRKKQTPFHPRPTAGRDRQRPDMPISRVQRHDRPRTDPPRPALAGRRAHNSRERRPSVLAPSRHGPPGGDRDLPSRRRLRLHVARRHGDRGAQARNVNEKLNPPICEGRLPLPAVERGRRGKAARAGPGNRASSGPPRADPNRP